MSDSTENNPTIEKLKAEISAAQRQLDLLIGLQSRKPNPTTAALVEAQRRRLDKLNVVRFDYMGARRSVPLYQRGLATGRWNGQTLDESNRADLKRRIAVCKAYIARIDAAVLK